MTTKTTTIDDDDEARKHYISLLCSQVPVRSEEISANLVLCGSCRTLKQLCQNFWNQFNVSIPQRVKIRPVPLT